MLGLLREKELNAEPEATAEEAMRNGLPHSDQTSLSRRWRSGCVSARGFGHPGEHLGQQANRSALPSRGRATSRRAGLNLRQLPFHVLW
jgi:hypothetical protein